MCFVFNPRDGVTSGLIRVRKVCVRKTSITPARVTFRIKIEVSAIAIMYIQYKLENYHSGRNGKSTFLDPRDQQGVTGGCRCVFSVDRTRRAIIR